MKINTIIIFYLTIVITSLLMLKTYEKYSENKLVFSKKNIINVLIISGLCFLNNIFMFTLIRSLLSNVLVFMLLKCIFKENTKKTLYYSIIMSCTILVLDLLTSLLLPLSIKNIEVLNQSLYFKVAFSIFINLMVYIILTNKYVAAFFKDLRMTSKNNKLFYLLGILGLLICNFWLFYSGQNTADKFLHIILCFTELLIFVFIIITLQNKYEKNIFSIKEEQLKQNLNLYSKAASEYKELKHNLMNDFLIIKTKLPKKEQAFMNEIINKYKSNYDWVNDLTDIPEGLQGLVFLKKNQAELKKIKFHLEYNVNKNIEKLFEINKNFKLYESLGILFDNAIEGAYESKEKMINVVFTYEKNHLQISILNTFNNDLDLDKIGKKNYSTKNRGSGIGLNYIRKQKNKFKINQSIRENIFITDIIINHKEKK